MEFKYYTKPWNPDGYIPGPPNREFYRWKETPESKQKTKEWEFRMEEWRKTPYSFSKKVELKSEKEPVILNRYQLMEFD